MMRVGMLNVVMLDDVILSVVIGVVADNKLHFKAKYKIPMPMAHFLSEVLCKKNLLDSKKTLCKNNYIDRRINKQMPIL